MGFSLFTRTELSEIKLLIGRRKFSGESKNHFWTNKVPQSSDTELLAFKRAAFATTMTVPLRKTLSVYHAQRSSQFEMLNCLQL